MRIFLTGATGFIGKHVFKRLYREGHTILLVSRDAKPNIFGLKSFPKRVRVIRGDLQSMQKWESKVKKFRPDALIHLAWEGLPQANIELSIKNIEYSLRLFAFAAQNGIKHIIGVGTQWEYGDRKGVAREDDALRPFNPLAAAKISLQYFGEALAKEKNTKFSWLRLFSVYGPGQRSGALIPSVVRSLAAGATPQIKSLDAKNDFIYVEDVARAITLVLRKQKPQMGIYNVASGKLTSIHEIMREMYKIFGKKMDTNLKSHGKSHVPGLIGDISKIKKEIGWKPQISTRAGIVETVSYFKRV